MSRYDGLVAWMSAHGGAWPRARGHLGRMSSMSEVDAEEHRHAQWVQWQRQRGNLGVVEPREGVTREELLEQLNQRFWDWRDNLLN